MAWTLVSASMYRHGSSGGQRVPVDDAHHSNAQRHRAGASRSFNWDAYNAMQTRAITLISRAVNSLKNALLLVDGMDTLVSANVTVVFIDHHARAHSSSCSKPD
jgi:hypothetical protein